MWSGTATELADAALSGRHDHAWTICAAYLERGRSVADLVEAVLAPAQVDVGRRWLDARITVSDEHRATAVVDGVLARLELRQRRGPRSPVVVCASPEGDGHTLGPRMVGCVLGATGVNARYVG